MNTRNSKPISDGKREKKSKREGLKEISNANKEDGACSNLSSPKKSKVPEGASEKELKTDVEDGVVPLVKKKYKKKVSDETSRPSEKKTYENEMKIDVEDGGVPLEKKKSKKRISDEASRVSEKTSEKELKTDGKDVDVPLEKKKSKKRVSNETSMCPIKPYGKRRKDGEIHKDLGVSNALEDDNANANANAKAAVKSREIKKCAMNLEQREVHVDLPLPQGTILTSVWGIDLSPKDIGHALQFFEFCTAFGKVILLFLYQLLS